ncbi:MAG: phosphate ABC transporter substrate-binding protein, partial [Planctomycetota bacterium]
TTVQPIVEKAAAEFRKEHPDVQFAIGGGGSSHGVKAAASGEVVIGAASRELKESEKTEYPDLVVTTIAEDGIAMIVNAKNPVKEITKEQVQAIYTGKITNWKELGGNDQPIFVVGKEEGHSTLELFLEYFDLEAENAGKAGKYSTMVYRKEGDSEFASVKVLAIGSNSEEIAQVILKPNAIAYVSIGTAESVAAKSGRIRLLALDGVEASVENVANHTYPLRRPLNLLTKGEPQGIVKQFIDFMLGKQGQQVVVDQEFVSVTDEL